MGAKPDFKCEGFLRAVSSFVLTLLRDERGIHFIQTCIGTQTDEENEFIYSVITQNCSDIAIHKDSFGVLRHCITHGTNPQRLQLVWEIMCHALQLGQHPFRNYIIQYLLDQKDGCFRESIIGKLAGHVQALKKSICVAEDQSRRGLIDKVIDSLDVLLTDPYGNYCVQTALDYAEPSQRAAVSGLPPISNCIAHESLAG
ncbi:ARM repeat-containing protein [Ramaria rubella]|nr:ARM repeat-containing protein [Ramaria rubella]